ncbi:MAG TPA: hypothetical protein VFA26_03850 [Gemmataceae bacterium]|nr:hypothetical protein [Gemmataceae bacterium]
MSRAYRIRVRESLSKVVKAHDRISTQLEVLEILPREQMAELLGRELEQRGYERKDGTATRKVNGVTVSIELETGTVTVQVEASQEVAIEGQKEGRAYDDMGPHAKQVERGLREELKKDLEKQADQRRERLQSEVTDRLEGQLADLRQELSQAVNRATAEALKQKARQMGRIKEMTEDERTGSLTIVVEV